MSNIYTDLDQLGETEVEVVAKLRSLGIRGTKHSASHCQVSEYLISLGFSGIFIGGGKVITDSMRAWLPLHVASFLLALIGRSCRPIHLSKI
jgi:hypothetical protein